MAASLIDAMHDRFAADAGLVAEFGHVEDGPAKFWAGAVEGGDEGVAVISPPYLVVSDLGSGAAGLSFARGFSRPVTVLLKTFAASRSEADRLGGLVNAALLNPSRSRPRLAWDGGSTTVDEVLVFSSELGRDGPVYTVIGRAALTGKPA